MKKLSLSNLAGRPISGKPIKVKNCILGYRQRRPRRLIKFPSLRLSELGRIIEHRYGAGGVDTDGEGENYFAVALSCLIAVGEDPMSWAARFTPKWFLGEGGEESISGLIEAFTKRPQGISADDAGWRLRLSYADRTILGIRTIGAFDKNKRARTLESKKRRAARARARRAANGALPRTECAARRKPWLACGLSRTRWYALGKPSAVDECVLHNISLNIMDHEPVQALPMAAPRGCSTVASRLTSNSLKRRRRRPGAKARPNMQ